MAPLPVQYLPDTSRLSNQGEKNGARSQHAHRPFIGEVVSLRVMNRQNNAKIDLEISGNC